MGHYSWIDCKDGTQIIMNEDRPSYVLVPENFKNYGDDKAPHHITECCYRGYGMFGRYDIYELVADWNRDAIPSILGVTPDRENGLTDAEYERFSSSKRPTLSNYPGMYDFEKENMADKGMTEEEIEKADLEYRQKHLDAGIRRYESAKECLYDFVMHRLTDEEMEEKYGEDYKREIGIDISSDDEKNALLPYPIKITHDPEAIFEESDPSISDEHQGVYYNAKMDTVESIINDMSIDNYIYKTYANLEFSTRDGYLVPIEFDFDGTAEDFIANINSYANTETLDFEMSDDEDYNREMNEDIKEQLKALSNKLDEAFPPVNRGEDPEL